MNKLGRCVVKDYSHYTVKDFVHDQFFNEWVLNSDTATTLFWKQWLKTHPEKRSTVDEAKKIIRILNYPVYKLSDDDVKELWHRIQTQNSDSR